MSVAPVSTNLVSSAESKKRKLPELDGVEEKEVGVELQVHLFDSEGLCNAIVYTKNADEVIAINPDLLSAIVHYSLKDLLAIMKIPMIAFEVQDQKKIERTVKILYTMSLRNSRHNEATKELEKNLPLFLNLSKKEHFADLIRRGARALSDAPKTTLVALQQQIGDVSELNKEINKLLNLFYFSEPENKERIDNLITFTKHFGGAPVFPICIQFFPQLYQNLAICQYERAELSQLRNALLLRAGELRLKTTPLLAPSREIPLAPDRQKLYETFSRIFWDVGAHTLETAFRKTFEEKWAQRVYLPDSFVRAVKRTSKLDGYGHLNFHKLLYERIPALEERFVSEIWSGFLEPASLFGATDDFIRLILSKLPEATFRKLEKDILPEAGRLQMVHDTVTQFLSQEIRGPVTFMTLSRFLDKART